MILMLILFGISKLSFAQSLFVTLNDDTTVVGQTSNEASQDALVKEVLKWSEKNVIHLFNFNYKNYAKEFEQDRPLFTKSGFHSFEKLWKESRNLEAIEMNKLAVSASLMGKANLIKSGEEKSLFFLHQYVWTIKVPLLIKYWNAEQEMKMQAFTIIKVIREEPKAKNKNFLIDNIEMEDAKPGFLEIRITPGAE